ncbi:unnamed protein product [Fusarium graminearum]|nr:unnamed protein product [Fusarium graminearum]
MLGLNYQSVAVAVAAAAAAAAAVAAVLSVVAVAVAAARRSFDCHAYASAPSSLFLLLHCCFPPSIDAIAC